MRDENDTTSNHLLTGLVSAGVILGILRFSGATYIDGQEDLKEHLIANSVPITKKVYELDDKGDTLKVRTDTIAYKVSVGQLKLK